MYLKNLPQPRTDFWYTSTETDIYVFGGDGENIYETLPNLRYNFIQNEWFPIKSFPFDGFYSNQRNNTNIERIDKDIYILSTRFAPLLCKYDILRDEWSPMRSVNMINVHTATIFKMGASLYLCAERHANYLHIWKYLPNENRWTRIPSRLDDVMMFKTMKEYGFRVYAAGVTRYSFLRCFGYLRYEPPEGGVFDATIRHRNKRDYRRTRGRFVWVPQNYQCNDKSVLFSLTT